MSGFEDLMYRVQIEGDRKSRIIDIYEKIEFQKGENHLV